MSVAFPSLDFFERLKRGLGEDPASTEGVAESDAYCGLVIGDGVFVVELDGRECSAVVQGGNLLDLDFALGAKEETWREMLRSIVANGGADDAQRLETLVESGALEILGENEDGPELARAALPMLQAFLDQARKLDLDLS